ncbi:MAG: hypothetical protein HN348_06230, partial [Proteobacteria bacterium]|nr:hypothetical protein [Pseudomonadota bacterium]
MYLLFIGLVACHTQESITIEGTILESREADASPLAEATVKIREANGDLWDETSTQSSGAFSVLAPAGQNLFAEIRAADFVHASFNGLAGLSEVQPVGDGLLFGFSEAELQEWRDLFAGCPGADGGGGVVLGDIRVYGLQEEDTGEPPLVTTGYVTAVGEDEEWEACYL